MRAGALRRDGLDELLDRVAHESLLRTISLADCLVLNDAELEQLTDEPNLTRAARKALELGPSVVIAKQGEYGSAMFTREGGYFGLTAYPTGDIVEPTGAGDTFAGGLMGFLAAHEGEIDEAALRRAMAYGTACASFNVEGFGSERLYELEPRRDRRAGGRARGDDALLGAGAAGAIPAVRRPERPSGRAPAPERRVRRERRSPAPRRGPADVDITTARQRRYGGPARAMADVGAGHPESRRRQRPPNGAHPTVRGDPRRPPPRHPPDRPRRPNPPPHRRR